MRRPIAEHCILLVISAFGVFLGVLVFAFALDAHIRTAGGPRDECPLLLFINPAALIVIAPVGGALLTLGYCLGLVIPRHAFIRAGLLVVLSSVLAFGISTYLAGYIGVLVIVPAMLVSTLVAISVSV